MIVVLLLNCRLSQTEISSRHLANFVARRKKRLNTVGPAAGGGLVTRIPRPESVYRRLPS